ncbi:2-dehydro-3-deoxygalactonokinase [Massilia sp. 9I]|uniref:2-dehydro-3-deoxygalactonokinase n=1 Tax=Massilia sp. 9I TaxID=2653152 RepID=UPI0012F02AFD|nr:2-dehydro-3-deoxygalactonokinase [Massilia sp. 9I]VXC61984.1 2-dehydro-3-deoxygalactonokinase [Massilia sp. 9I]
MSHADSIVGINWGSTNFRAYLIGPDGTLRDEFSRPAGVANLDRAGMEALMRELAQRWPRAVAGEGAVYAAGMVGSNIGWQEAPYVVAPAGLAALAAGTVPVDIGGVALRIVPGMTCTRAYDGGPDILRGEEIELFGFAAMEPGWNGFVALPGTHTKWVRFADGQLQDFFTSMSGEMFDRLTSSGLLASIVEGEAQAGDAFFEGVRLGGERALGLGTLLFGARARVIRGQLARSDAASFLRGLLIGAEIADALAIHPALAGARLPLIGSGPVCRLYAAALEAVGVQGCFVDSREACLRGFSAVHLEGAR